MCNNVACALHINIVREHTIVEPPNIPSNDHIPQLFPSLWTLWTRIPLARPEHDLLELHTDDEKIIIIIFFLWFGLDFTNWCHTHTTRCVIRTYSNLTYHNGQPQYYIHEEPQNRKKKRQEQQREAEQE